MSEIHELTYFGPGYRALYVLAALHAGGMPYKLNSVSFEEFGAAKKEGKYPTGLPILKLPNGREVTQSFAMARYVAKLPSVNLYPSDLEEALNVDVVMDIVFDIMAKCPSGGELEARMALRAEYAETKLLDYSKAIEATVLDRPFVAGNDLTIGDLILFFFTDMVYGGDFDGIPPTYFEDKNLTRLISLHSAIKAHPIVVNFKASLET